MKYKEFIDVIPTMCCQNSSCIMDSRICGEGMIQISLGSTIMIDPVAQDIGYTGSIPI